MSTRPRPRRLLWLAAGFIVWAHAFLALYAVNAIGCAFAWPAHLQRLVLWLLLAAHLVVLAWIVARHWRRRHESQGEPRPMPFVDYVGLGVAITGWAATLFTLAPSFFVSLCI
jgi:hypothetical protein